MIGPVKGPPGVWRNLLLVGALLVIVGLPVIGLRSNPYWVNILAVTYLFAGLAGSWNIIGGLGGQFSFGHGVFFALGAYTTARFYLDLGVSPWISLLPAAALAGVVAFLISLPTFRLRGPFFAIATIAINEATFTLANYFDWPTGGAAGILIPFRPGLANMIFAEQWKYALLMFCYMAIVVLVTVAIRRGRLGHYLIAVREDEDAAQAAGVSVLRTKLLGMVISAALTGSGGGLFAMLVRVIDPPTLFSLSDVGVKFALITLIGGIGTVIGPVVGAVLVVPLESWLRGALTGEIPGGDLIVLGLVLVGAALFMKRGIVGAAAASLRRFER
jgi:branched-chain amino acid transport system permease protein